MKSALPLHLSLLAGALLAGAIAFLPEAVAQADGTAKAKAPPISVGVAVVDITPGYPVRLNGFGFRRTESEGVTQRIHAKALAFAGADGKEPAVLITADTLCVPDDITKEVARRLEKSGVKLERLAITASHTHTAPMLKNVAPTIFGGPIPPDQQERIDRYTKEFTDHLEKAALAALKDLRPATVEWAVGTVGFAINRRTAGGPVDHDFPILTVRNPAGGLRAIYFSYACHCVTMSHNKISGDWAGYAQEMVQARHPGCVALASVGCGADSNPSNAVRGEAIAACEDQGRQIADEVDRLLKGKLTALTDPPQTKYARLDIAFDTPRTRAEWEERAKKQDATGYQARVTLERLDRGEALPDKLNYPIQSWLFGERLALIFLPGETVVDYALRLKRELDRNRIWINGYSNDARCYIPSERILKEGGYEGGGAMIYYDMPNRFAPGLEQKIIDTVRAQIPEKFTAAVGAEGTRPMTPQESLASIQTKPDLEVELVAAEPLVASPVAIDWDARGRLLVCEMYDYPLGVDGNGKHGGRIKRLEDTNGDGSYDKPSVLVDGLPYPTGLMAWGKGVFIGAAPDVLFAEDADDDGVAERVDKMLTGFPTENYQARVNGFALGLDNWIYGANGLLATAIHPVRWPGQSANSEVSADTLVRNHDFRFRPSTQQLEAVSGLTQQGRVRDDWGRWFACDNSRLLLHFPHEERYFARNKFVPSPDSIAHLTGRAEGNRLHPISRLLERFNDSHAANHTTSACGVAIYRDDLLGKEYHGSAFTCEPVHNLVHREVIAADGTRVSSHRAKDESKSEFLASTDNWFRPVQARTGPDGALYVVDMYRFLIEHPRWIQADRLAKIDARAGADLGRIYRIRPRDKSRALRAAGDLTRLNSEELARALHSPNGTERDRVHVELLTRYERKALDPLPRKALEEIAANTNSPAAQVQALSALEGLGVLSIPTLTHALRDSHPGIRSHAIRLAERQPDALRRLLPELLTDPEPEVRLQLALSLGEWNDPKAGLALADLAKANPADPALRAAVLSSSATHAVEVLETLAASVPAEQAAAWLGPLTATIVGANDPTGRNRALRALLPHDPDKAGAEHFAALATLMDSLPADASPATLLEKDPAALEKFRHIVSLAQAIAKDTRASDALRASVIPLLSHRGSGEAAMLYDLAAASDSSQVRAVALKRIQKIDGPNAPRQLLARWQLAPLGVRAEFMNALLSRPDGIEAVLAAIEGGTVSAAEVSLASRQQLAQFKRKDLREKAARLLPVQPTTGREQALNIYQAALHLTGAPSKGSEVFALACATCHALEGKGVNLGPDLAPLANKDAGYWLKNILDPNAIIEPRFVSYLVKLKDQRAFAGVIKDESATSLRVMMPAGLSETILRNDVEALQALPISLMPEGLEQAIPPQAMADLIAYLRTPRVLKQVAGNKPEPVAPDKDGIVLLPAAKAEIRGGNITFEGEFKNIGFWQGEDDQVTWTVESAPAGVFDVYLDYACAQGDAGNAFRLSAGGVEDAAVSGSVKATGADWSRYVQVKAGQIRLTAGGQKIIVRPQGKLRGALMDLRAIALAPEGTAPAWSAAQKPEATTPPKTPAEIAKAILDPKAGNVAREAHINANPNLAADLIVEMTRDLTGDAKIEYERIPWIWRVAIAAGKRNDAAQLRHLLDASLPPMDKPLRDWQAVVIGGGIINGLSQLNLWPGDRVAEIIGEDKALRDRWQHALDLAAVMTDKESVPQGTRYDALRMIGVQPWTRFGAMLKKYLKKGTPDELQMGAVNGLVDVNAPEAAQALIEAWPDLSTGNRKLAAAGLLRTEVRRKLLAEAVATGKIKEGDVDKTVLQELRSPASPPTK